MYPATTLGTNFHLKMQPTKMQEWLGWTLSTSSFSSLNFFIEKFPHLLPQEAGESRVDAIDALEVQFAELQAHSFPEGILKEERCDVQWSAVGEIRNPDGKLKFGRVAKLMLDVLVIPHSNAQCERIFSSVKKTRTEFRASMSNSALQNLLLAKDHQSGPCYEKTHSAAFLKKAKSATVKSLQNK